MILKSHSLDTETHELHDFSVALQETFQDVYLAIVSRITESDDVQTMKLKETGFTDIPEISRKKSVLDDDISELIVGEALNEFFKVFQQVIDDKAKIARHVDKLLDKEINGKLLEEILALKEKDGSNEDSKQNEDKNSSATTQIDTTNKISER